MKKVLCLLSIVMFTFVGCKTKAWQWITVGAEIVHTIDDPNHDME